MWLVRYVPVEDPLPLHVYPGAVPFRSRRCFVLASRPSCISALNTASISVAVP